MFINPKIAIERGWVISGIKNPDKQIQPNAIDFTLDSLKELDPNAVPVVSETEKVMRPSWDVYPVSDGKWLIERGIVYDGTSDMYIELPDGVAAVLYTRSTFARNGIFIMSGLYDTGYKGHVGFTIYSFGGPRALVEPGTRVGQIAFIEASAAKTYAGGWNHEIGTHYTEGK